MTWCVWLVWTWTLLKLTAGCLSPGCCCSKNIVIDVVPGSLVQLKRCCDRTALQLVLVLFQELTKETESTSGAGCSVLFLVFWHSLVKNRQQKYFVRFWKRCFGLKYSQRPLEKITSPRLCFHQCVFVGWFVRMITQKPLHRSNLDEGCVDRYLDKGTDRFLTIFNTASALAQRAG